MSDDGQKTQKPTPKRVKEFRKRGEVALSRDVVSAAAFGGGAIALLAYGSAGFAALREVALVSAASADGGPHPELVDRAVHAFFTAAVPVVIGAAVGALAAIAGQLGWPPALKSLSFDLTKMNPLANVTQVFGLGEMAKRTGVAVAKLIAVGIVVAASLAHAMHEHPSSPAAFASLAAATLSHVIEMVIGALVVIAAIDFYLTKRKLDTRMMMSTEEVKREYRESDGDPQMKGKRKQRAKEMAKRRMAAAVATADVVIVNPTHYAVALRYDETKDAAPIVVAKGTDEAAEKIREVARQHGVPVLPRPPLARALHKLVKEGKPVPSNLFKAVAEVLAFVYRIRHRSPDGHRGAAS